VQESARVSRACEKESKEEGDDNHDIKEGRLMPMMLYNDLHTRLARYAIIARECWLETTYVQKKQFSLQFSFDNYTVEYLVRPRSVLKKTKKPKIKRFPSMFVLNWASMNSCDMNCINKLVHMNMRNNELRYEYAIIKHMNNNKTYE